MATLIDSAEYTLNEVYQIAATGPVEGAASGANFNGTGISNQPHQQLANRTAYLKQRQDVNISSIGALQAFAAKFVSSMAANGYLKLAAQDISRGAIQPILQWGFFSLVGQTPSSLKNALWQLNFPIAFPTLCLWFSPQWATNEITGAGAFVVGSVVIEAGPITKTQAQVFTDYDNAANIDVANNSGA